MLIFAVISQAFAVIGQDGEQGILRGRFLFHRVHRAAQLLIDVSDFRIVGIAGILPHEFCGWRNVGLMRVIKV